MYSIYLSLYQPCAIDSLVVYLYRGLAGVLKTLFRVEWSSKTKIVYIFLKVVVGR